MTLAEIVQQVNQLPPEEQLALAQMILEGLDRVEFISPPVIDAPDFLTIPDILNPNGKIYTDEDIENLRWSYMEEKYL